MIWDQCLEIGGSILNFEVPKQKAEGPGQMLQTIGLTAPTYD